MEIERKFTIKELPENLDSYPHVEITQAYLCTEPVMRIRKQDEEYIFTYKGKGLMVREEYNLPLTAEAFQKLLPKAEGHVISKTRYQIPLRQCYSCDHALSDKEADLIAELDLFKSPTDLIMAEVEFPDEESAHAFTPPAWFDQDVTDNPAYHNSNMSKR
nr:CYTH domain-containing protein [Lachnospiraceae bacterium]